MSNRTYNELWREIYSDISQNNPKDSTLTLNDKEGACAQLAVSYANYVGLLRKLEVTHDQIVHPQKKRLTRQMLIALMGRLIELKLKLYELGATDFPNMDPVYSELKMAPEDLVAMIPRLFVEERIQALNERRQMLEEKQAKFLEMDNKISFPDLTVEEAIATIQRNERGRQGSIRAKYMRDMRLQEQQDGDLDTEQDENAIKNAAIKIQKTWRGYIGRKEAQYRKCYEDEFLGFSGVPSSKERKLADINSKRRKLIQKQHEEEYQLALESIKEKIRKLEGPDMKESYQDTFRQWYMNYKREQGKFPDFPADEEWKLPKFAFGQAAPSNGPVPVSGKPSTPSAKNQKPGSADKKKVASKSDAKGSGKGSKKSGKEEAGDQNTSEMKSIYQSRLQEQQSRYISDWLNKNEADNFAQKHDVEIIKTAKREEVDAEIKVDLFNSLREELENLKLAMEKDSKKKKKETGKKKKKDAKAGKKGKKEKDLTGGRPTPELVDELINAGIMQRPSKCQFRHFKAVPVLLQTKPLNPEPSSLDVKRQLIDYAVLPLGMDALDDAMNPLPPRSLMLYGPTGVGKSLLVNIIANEVGASVFNLSPKVTAGQFVGKASVARMIYTVFKVAREMAPAVLIIDDVEAVFCKKVPKEDTSDPKRIRKDLVKAMNGIKPSDRVLVIGMSRNPFYSDAKALSDAFQRQIYVARPNYSLREAMWREWLLDRISTQFNNDQHKAKIDPPSGATSPSINGTIPASSVTPDQLRKHNSYRLIYDSFEKYVDCSLLARISAGMSGAMIIAIIARCLPARRVKQLSTRSLVTNEIIHHLLQLPEPDRKIEQDFIDWTLKLPVFKKRELVLGLAVADEPDKGKNGKGKKK